MIETLQQCQLPSLQEIKCNQEIIKTMITFFGKTDGQKSNRRKKECQTFQQIKYLI